MSKRVKKSNQESQVLDDAPIGTEVFTTKLFTEAKLASQDLDVQEYIREIGAQGYRHFSLRTSVENSDFLDQQQKPIPRHRITILAQTNGRTKYFYKKLTREEILPKANQDIIDAKFVDWFTELGKEGWQVAAFNLGGPVDSGLRDETGPLGKFYFEVLAYKEY